MFADVRQLWRVAPGRRALLQECGILTCMSHDYLERILKARVYDVAIATPLDAAPRLSRRLGNSVLFSGQVRDRLSL